MRRERPAGVLVPDVLGLPFAAAARIGDEAGLSVTGLGPDGRGVEADAEASVVAQDPEPGVLAEAGSRLVLHVGGGGAGDRALLDPPPSEHGGHRDLDDDPDLQPA